MENIHSKTLTQIVRTIKITKNLNQHKLLINTYEYLNIFNMSCSRAKSFGRNTMAPKPVQARSMIHHGLFGMTRVAQHFIFDDKWTPESLTVQFRGYSQMLSKYILKWPKHMSIFIKYAAFKNVGWSIFNMRQGLTASVCRRRARS